MLLEETNYIDNNIVLDVIYDSTGKEVLSLVNSNGRWIKK